nr:hypothetical protein [Tanacetum cinerariifolium]
GLVKHKMKSYKGNEVLQPKPSRNTKSSVRRISKEVVKPKEGNESEKANESKKDNESEEAEEIEEDKESEVAKEVVKDVKTKVVKGKKKVVLSNSKKRNKEVEDDVKGNESEADESEEEVVKDVKNKYCKWTVPSSLFAAIRDSQVDMESFLSDIGFSSLHNVYIETLPQRFARFVVRAFRVPLGGTSIFDLPEMPLDGLFVKEWFKQFDPKPLKKIRACDIAEKLVLTKTVDFMFKVNFLMLFANVMSTADTKKAIVNLTVLRRIREDTNITGIDWCGFINKCLHGKPYTVGGFYIGPQELEIQDQVISKLDLHKEWTDSELDQTEDFYDVRENMSETRTSSVPPTDKKSFYSIIEERISMISAEKITLEDLLKRANAKFSNDEKVIELCEKYRRLFKESVFVEDFQAHIYDFDNNDNDGGGKNDVHGEADVNEELEDMLDEEIFTQWIEKISIGLGGRFACVASGCSADISCVSSDSSMMVTRSSPNKRIVKPPTYLTSPYMNKRTKVTSLIKRLEFVLESHMISNESHMISYESRVIFLIHTKAIIEWTIDEEQQWKVFSDEISALFEHDVTYSSILGVDLAFFPICASRRFYVVVFHLKSPSAMMILDNSNFGETYNSKYKAVCEPLKKFFAMHLKNYNHPKHIFVAKLKHRISKLKWSTTKNHSDCGVFTMIHLEHYFGKPVGQWDFGLCKELDEQVLMLRHIRFKIPTKILLHEFNVHAEKMFDLVFKCESENDKQTRISIIVNAIKNMDERDPAKTKTFVENHEEDALKNK